jgi:hypothetical protein
MSYLENKINPNATFQELKNLTIYRTLKGRSKYKKKEELYTALVKHLKVLQEKEEKRLEDQRSEFRKLIRSSLNQLAFLLINYPSHKLTIRGYGIEKIEAIIKEVEKVKRIFNHFSIPEKQEFKELWNLLVKNINPILEQLKKEKVKVKKKKWVERVNFSIEEKKKQIKISKEFNLVDVSNFLPVESGSSLGISGDSKVTKWIAQRNNEICISEDKFTLYSYLVVEKGTISYFQKKLKIIINSCNKNYLFVYLSLKSAKSGHANLLIIDIRKKIIERFEPHGATASISDFADKYLELKGFTYLSANQTCTLSALQKNERLCAAWTFLIMELKVLNLTQSVELIGDVLLTILKREELSNYIHRYAYRLRLLERIEVSLLPSIERDLVNEVEEFLHFYEIKNFKFPLEKK